MGLQPTKKHLGHIMCALADSMNTIDCVDTVTIVMLAVKKLVMGKQKDHQIKVTLKADKVIETVKANNFESAKEIVLEDFIISDETLLNPCLMLDCVTLRDRKLVENIVGMGLYARVSKNGWDASVKHLFSIRDQEQSELAIYISIKI